MKTIYRYEVPVDDRPHLIPTTSAPKFVAARQADVVEFWAEHDTDAEPWSTAYIVVGTGHPIPDGATYVATALAEFGLVWHLYEIPPATARALEG